MLSKHHMFSWTSKCVGNHAKDQRRLSVEAIRLMMLELNEISSVEGKHHFDQYIRLCL